MSEPAGFAATGSFECGDVTAVAPGDGCVAVAAGERVELVSGDDRVTVEFDARVVDVAVGDRLYALAGGELSAVSMSGTTVWSVEVADAEAVAALPDGSRVAVAAGDRLLGFDGETGAQPFAVERPWADVGGEYFLTATGDRFVVAAWSFVTVLDADGGEVYETSLDGAIRAAGVVDDVVVAALQNDRLVGVDSDGEEAWSLEIAVAALAGRAAETLVVSAATGPMSLSADGSTGRLSDLPDAELVAATGGDPVCAVSDGTVSVYRERGTGATLDVSVPNAAVTAGRAEALGVTVENAGDRPVSVTLSPSADGVAVTTGGVDVDLAAGESTTIEVGVDATDAAAGDEATLALDCGGNRVLDAPLAVRSADPADLLAADAELTEVSDGTATVALTLTNEGASTMSGVSVARGPPVGDLAPGESATAEVEAPLSSGGVSRSVTVESPDVESVVDADLPADAVSLSLSRDGEFVDVRVDSDVDAAVSDTLRVRGDGFRAVERRVTVAGGGAFVVALRPTPRGGSGAVSASLAGLDLSAREEFVGFDEPATPEPAADAAGAGSAAAPRSESTADAAGTAGDEPTGASTDEPAESPGGDHADATASAGGNDAVSDDPVPDLGGDDSVGGSDHDATANAGSSRVRPSLSVTRRLSEEEPVERGGVREEITVSNDGDAAATDVSLRVGDEFRPLPDVDADESVTVTRLHSFGDPGRQSLPAGTVTAGDGSEHPVESASVRVQPADVLVEAVVEDDDPATARVRLTNRTDRDYRVSRVGVEGVGVWSEEFAVPAGETTTWSRTADAAVSGDQTRTVVELESPDGDGERRATLAPTVPAASGDGVDALDVRVGDETRVFGSYGSVVAVVENQGDQPLADVEIAASGDAVSEMMYGGAEAVDELAPGDRVEHFVDVAADDADVEVDVSVSATVDGEDRAETVTVGGPAPDDEADWSDDALAAWRVDRSGDSSMALPDRVSTGYRDG